MHLVAVILMISQVTSLIVSVLQLTSVHLINEAWLSHNAFSKAEFIDPGLSDHSPTILKLSGIDLVGPRPFKFFNH